MNLDQQQSRLKLLIAKGKEQRYLTYAEINDHLPQGIVDPEQIEDIISMINDMGIAVHEVAPDPDALLLMGSTVNEDDDDTEEAAAALATIDSELGRTTDPVRMYMREMGTVDLLTREGEIKIAKRIESGLRHAHQALAGYPATIRGLLAEYAAVETGEAKLTDILTGYIDPHAKEEPIQTPQQQAAKNDDDEHKEPDPGPDPEGSRRAFREDQEGLRTPRCGDRGSRLGRTANHPNPSGPRRPIHADQAQGKSGQSAHRELPRRHRADAVQRARDHAPVRA